MVCRFCSNACVQCLESDKSSWSSQTCTNTAVFICRVSTRSVSCPSQSTCSEMHCFISSLFCEDQMKHMRRCSSTNTQQQWWGERSKPLIKRPAGPRPTDGCAPVYQCVPWVCPPAPASSSDLHRPSACVCRTFLTQTTQFTLIPMSFGSFDYAFSCQSYQCSTAK